MNIKKTIGALIMCAISATPMMAQQASAESYQPCTYQEMEQLTVELRRLLKCIRHYREQLPVVSSR